MKRRSSASISGKRKADGTATLSSTVKGVNLGVFKTGIGKLKGLMQSKESKFNEDAAKHQMLIFNELSKYIIHFCNMSLPFDQANEILVYFCNLYQMEKGKMHFLLTELQSN